MLLKWLPSPIRCSVLFLQSSIFSLIFPPEAPWPFRQAKEKNISLETNQSETWHCSHLYRKSSILCYRSSFCHFFLTLFFLQSGFFCLHVETYTNGFPPIPITIDFNTALIEIFLTFWKFRQSIYCIMRKRQALGRNSQQSCGLTCGGFADLFPEFGRFDGWVCFISTQWSSWWSNPASGPHPLMFITVINFLCKIRGQSGRTEDDGCQPKNLSPLSSAGTGALLVRSSGPSHKCTA